MRNWRADYQDRPPHPNSPVGRTFDWSSLDLPHPHSPVGRQFDYGASLGAPHPTSPAGRDADFLPAVAVGELNCIQAEIAEIIGRKYLRAEADYLNSLFERAVSLMDFSTAPNEGILYSGEQGGVYMSELAKKYASQKSKRPLASTKGGSWLNRWEPLADLIGPQKSDRIWFAASIRYTNLLIGDVIVFLATPDYNAVFRRGGLGEHRALYQNKNVKRILYVIEHPAPGFDQPKKAPNGRAWFFPSIKHLDDYYVSIETF